MFVSKYINTFDSIITVASQHSANVKVAHRVPNYAHFLLLFFFLTHADFFLIVFLRVKFQREPGAWDLAEAHKRIVPFKWYHLNHWMKGASRDGVPKISFFNLPNASVKNYHILRFGVFWDPRAIFSQANDTRRIAVSLLTVFIKFTVTSFRGPKRPQKALGGLTEIWKSVKTGSETWMTSMIFPIKTA